jgi:hypothetical protein
MYLLIKYLCHLQSSSAATILRLCTLIRYYIDDYLTSEPALLLNVQVEANLAFCPWFCGKQNRKRKPIKIRSLEVIKNYVFRFETAPTNHQERDFPQLVASHAKEDDVFVQDKIDVVGYNDANWLLKSYIGHNIA